MQINILAVATEKGKTMEEKVIGGKLPDDEELEKLFEGMSREAVREVANQNSPSKRVTSKKTSKKKEEMDVDCGGIKPIDSIKPPKKVIYVEPADYIPKDLREKYKLGEFAEPKTEK